MALFLHSDIIDSVPLFKGCSDDTVSAVVMALSIQIYLPGDWIVSEGEPVGAKRVFALDYLLFQICFSKKMRKPKIKNHEKKVPQKSRFCP